MILVVIAIIGSTKWMLKDFGAMTRQEIEVYFETDEERAAREERLLEMQKRLDESDL